MSKETTYYQQRQKDLKKKKPCGEWPGISINTNRFKHLKKKVNLTQVENIFKKTARTIEKLEKF